MIMRGVRGATTAEENTAAAVLGATRELLEELVTTNNIASSDLAAAIFTVTDDLDAAFPARAARELGWQAVPLLDAREIAVPDAVPRCIRVLLLWNCELSQDQIVHVYKRGAALLRPDLAR